MANGDEEESRHRARIGVAVRNARKGKGLTMVQLAEATGLSQSLISRIETGSVLPSVLTIYRLAEALECPVGALMPSPASTSDHRVVRRGKGLRIQEDPDREFSVTPLGRAGPHDQLQAFIYEFGTTSRWWPFQQESILYVLQGEVTIEWATGKKVQLRQGDSIHCDQAVPMRWVPKGGAVTMLGCHAAPTATHDLTGLDGPP